MSTVDLLVLGGTIAVLVGAVLRYTDAGTWWPLDLLDAIIDRVDVVLIAAGAAAITAGSVSRALT